MAKLTLQQITLADITLGRHQQTIWRQVHHDIAKMLWDEREGMKKKLKEMDEMDVEEHSPLRSMMSNLSCEKSPSKPYEHPIHDNTEMNRNKGIYEVMMRIKVGNKYFKNQLKCIKFPSAPLQVMTAAVKQNLTD